MNRDFVAALKQRYSKSDDVFVIHEIYDYLLMFVKKWRNSHQIYFV